jgi:hypothetical protein
MDEPRIPGAAGSAVHERDPQPLSQESAPVRLAEFLRALPGRARAEGWRGWSEADERAIEIAARELAGLERSLREGMRTAFGIGRQFGKQEDVLETLNREIAEAADGLGRAAWGAGGSSHDDSEDSC